MSSFSVAFDCYHGPVDLLLYLVRKHEVDVLELGLANLASTYLEYIDVLAEIDIDDVGDFLVIATTLMEIKCRMLLPRTEEVTSSAESETQQELVRHLLEYKRFKEAGALLWQRAQQQRQKLPRRASDLTFAQTDPAQQPLQNLELWDLVSAFGRLMRENVVPVAQGIVRDPTPISVYMQRIERIVLRAGGIAFAKLLGKRNTKPQIIGKFLAILELVKRGRVWIERAKAGDDIIISPPRFAPPFHEATNDDRIHDEIETPSVPVPLADSTANPPLHESPDSPPTQDTRVEDAVSGGAWEVHRAPEDEVPSASAWDDFEPIVDLGERSEPNDLSVVSNESEPAITNPPADDEFLAPPTDQSERHGEGQPDDHSKLDGDVS